MPSLLRSACVFLGCSFAAGTFAWGSEPLRREIEFGGTERSYLVHVPRADARQPRPLVVVLHGGAGTAQQMPAFTHFGPISEREGFVVLYPQGVGRRWNDGRVFRGHTESDADDVGFIKAAVDDVAGSVTEIDRGHVFAVGISNGGFMSLRLACEAADLFAAVAAVTATMPAELGERCRSARPVSVLVVNGTADPLVPYEGGFVRGPLRLTRGAIWSTKRTLDFWADRNGCSSPKTALLPDLDRTDQSRVVRTDYRCTGAHLALLRIEGGGHTWPGSSQFLPANWIGTVNRDIDASEAIWSFFRTAPPR
jgi:polyhydroxybutyrate depolymerase